MHVMYAISTFGLYQRNFEHFQHKKYLEKYKTHIDNINQIYIDHFIKLSITFLKN